MDIKEKVFVMLKPDAVKRKLSGKIISMFEDVGLDIVDMKYITASRDQAAKHYPEDDEWLTSVGNKSLNFYKENNLNPADFFSDCSAKEIGKVIKSRLVDYLTSGPMISIVFYGYDAIKLARKVAGKTIPIDADMGSVRGKFGYDNPMSSAVEKRSIQNLVHVSDSKEAVKIETAIWM